MVSQEGTCKESWIFALFICSRFVNCFATQVMVFFSYVFRWTALDHIMFVLIIQLFIP